MLRMLWYALSGLSPTNDEVRSRIRELLMGAEIAGQYRLDTYIMAGGFGHGWGATDLQTGKEVFVKTFKSQVYRMACRHG